MVDDKQFLSLTTTNHRGCMRMVSKHRKSAGDNRSNYWMALCHSVQDLHLSDIFRTIQPDSLAQNRNESYIILKLKIVLSRASLGLCQPDRARSEIKQQKITLNVILWYFCTGVPFCGHFAELLLVVSGGIVTLISCRTGKYRYQRFLFFQTKNYFHSSIMLTSF